MPSMAQLVAEPLINRTRPAPRSTRLSRLSRKPAAREPLNELHTSDFQHESVATVAPQEQGGTGVFAPGPSRSAVKQPAPAPPCTARELSAGIGIQTCTPEESTSGSNDFDPADPPSFSASIASESLRNLGQEVYQEVAPLHEHQWSDSSASVPLPVPHTLRSHGYTHTDTPTAPLHTVTTPQQPKSGPRSGTRKCTSAQLPAAGAAQVCTAVAPSGFADSTTKEQIRLGAMKRSHPDQELLPSSHVHPRRSPLCACVQPPAATPAQSAVALKPGAHRSSPQTMSASSRGILERDAAAAATTVSPSQRLQPVSPASSHPFSTLITTSALPPPLHAPPLLLPTTAPPSQLQTSVRLASLETRPICSNLNVTDFARDLTATPATSTTLPQSSGATRTLTLPRDHPALQPCEADTWHLCHTLLSVGADAAATVAARESLTAALALRATTDDLLLAGVSRTDLPLLRDVATTMCADVDVLSTAERFLVDTTRIKDVLPLWVRLVPPVVTTSERTFSTTDCIPHTQRGDDPQEGEVLKRAMLSRGQGSGHKADVRGCNVVPAICGAPSRSCVAATAVVRDRSYQTHGFRGGGAGGQAAGGVVCHGRGLQLAVRSPRAPSNTLMLTDYQVGLPCFVDFKPG
jgi:hypothetical protein